MKLPRSTPTSRNSTRCRPSWIALPMSVSGTSVPAARSPMCQSRKKSPTIFGKTLLASSPTRSLLSLSCSPRSTTASAAMPTSMPISPRLAKPSLVSEGWTRFLTSTPKVAPRCVSPLSSASSCRKASRPVRPAPGSVTSTFSSSSLVSETSMKKPRCMSTPKPKSSCQSMVALTAPRVSRPRPGMPMSKPMPAPASSSVPPSSIFHSIDSWFQSVPGTSTLVMSSMSAIVTTPSWLRSPRMFELVVQQVEQLLRDVVLVGRGRGLDRVAQAVDEVLAEIADHVRRVGQLVSDQRQAQAADLAAEGVLQQAEETVQAVDDQQQVVERAELAEVEREDLVRYVDELVTARADVAVHDEPVLGRERSVPPKLMSPR